MAWLTGLPWWSLLVCGALIGWLAEWILDLVYWRRLLGERDAKLVTVNKEVGLLQGENTRISGDLRTARTDYDGLNTRFVARNQEYDDLSVRLEGTEHDLSKANLEVDDYRTRVSTLDGELVEVRNTSAGYETELKDLRVKYIESSKQVKEKNGLLSGLRTQVGDLEGSMKGLHGQLGEKDQEISRISGLLGGKDSEIEGINAQLASQVELVNESTAKVGDIQGRLNTLEDENGNLRKTVADRNTTIDELRADLGSKDGELGEVRSKLGIGAGVGIAGALGAALVSSQSDADEKEQLTVRVGELETEVGQLQGEVSSLEEQKAALASDLDNANVWLTTYGETTEQLQAEIATGDSEQVAEVAEMENWLGVYGQATEELQATVAEKDAQLVEAKASLTAAQDVEDLQPKIDELSGRLNTLEVENTSLRKTLMTRNTLLDELRGDLDASPDTDLRGEVGGLLALRSTVSGLEQDVSGRDSQIGGLNAEIERLKAQLSSQESSASSNLDDLRAQLEELQFRVNTLDVENAALRKSLLSTKLEAKAAAASTVVTNFVPTQADNAGEIEVLRGLVTDKDGEIDDLNVQLADAIEVSRERGTNIDQLNDENAELRARLAAMKSAPAAGAGVGLASGLMAGGAIDLDADAGAVTGDDFTVIYGIGPVFQNRLYGAGIMTYADLCSSTPEAVEAAADPGVTTATAARWIEDACTISSGGTPPDREAEAAAMTGDDYTVIYGIGPVYQRRLYASGLYTYADLCGSNPEFVETACDPGVTPEDAAQWIEDACTLASGGTLPDRNKPQVEAAPVVNPDERDNLTKIKGIGKVFQGKLYDGGIYTWEQLSVTDESVLTDVIAPKDWQKIEPDSWKVQAAELARKKRARGGIMPDDLKQINGIGPVYEGKLKEAGIDTFAVLAKADPKRVSSIIDPDGWQEIDPAGWIAEAAELAKQKK